MLMHSLLVWLTSPEIPELPQLSGSVIVVTEDNGVGVSVDDLLIRRYLMPRESIPKSVGIRNDLEVCNATIFCSFMRMDLESFNYIENLIKVFAQTGPRPQAPVRLQLMVTLYRLAHTVEIATTFGIGHGSVLKFTRRVVEALDSTQHGRLPLKKRNALVTRTEQNFRDCTMLAALTEHICP